MCIDWFMFHPEMITEKYDESAEGYVNIGTREDPIAAVILGPELGKKAILRCHGNTESMYQSLWVLRDLIWRGYTVACVDYPGYGLSAAVVPRKRSGVPANRRWTNCRAFAFSGVRRRNRISIVRFMSRPIPCLSEGANSSRPVPFWTRGSALRETRLAPMAPAL